ncbi:MAG: maltooligosyltrehalose trehalohydrolase [Actinomycetota bacterium]|jgi:maltooligosyltrehalose trehalohydrolase|nr:maltooligosyltrehalose trehalohydrolase [Actinomycetota bacterium]
MAKSADGWHHVDVEGAGPGTRYGFSVDGGPVRPDPRSQSQPTGVHGLSEVVDHDAFEWSDGDWQRKRWPAALVYELHVGTFTEAGTFDAAIEKLPYLVGLGVDAVELMPVNEFPGERGWGYDGVDLFAPHHAYGGPEGLKRLVDACHRAGLAVMLDVVYNHFGPAGNYLQEFGPYLTAKHQTPWGMAVNLDDEGSEGVRRFLVDNASMWLRDYHFDGLRLDAVHAFADSSPVHFLAQLADEVGSSGFLVAESEVDNPRLFAYGLDAQWYDEFHHTLHTVLTGERTGYYAPFGSLGQLAAALRHGSARYVGFAQNHDQIGNRAKGERLSHLVGEGRARIAAALVMTSPFVPMLFMGEEWGASSPFQYFTDHDDADLGAAVTKGRRAEFAGFGWAPDDVPDPQDRATFERSKLDWSELDRAPHAGLLAWHRELIDFRRSHPDLVDAGVPVEVEVDEALGRLRMRRGRVEVRVNLGEASWDGVPPDGVAVSA